MRLGWKSMTLLLASALAMGAQDLRNWARQGVAVLIVEQQIDVALSVADRALVVERGAITLAGTAEELKQDRRVQDIYLGLTGTS